MNYKNPKKMVVTDHDSLRILNYVKKYKEHFEERGRKYCFNNTLEYKEIMNFFDMIIDRIETKFTKKGKEYNL